MINLFSKGKKFEDLVDISSEYNLSILRLNLIYEKIINKQYNRELLTKENYKNGIKERIESDSIEILKRYLSLHYKKRNQKP